MVSLHGAVNWHGMSPKSHISRLSRIHRPTGRLRFADGSRPSPQSITRQVSARLLTTVYRRMLFLAYRLHPRIPVYSAAIDVRFAELDPAEMPAYMAFRPDSDLAEIERRFNRRDRCFVGWHDGEIVDACWTAKGIVSVPYLERGLQVPVGDIYSYDSFTAREHRGHGLYMARNSFTARLNHAEGFERSIALGAFENYSAWLILTRSGLETLGAYHYIRAPGHGIYWQTAEPGRALPLLVSPNPLRSMSASAVRHVQT